MVMVRVRGWVINYDEKKSTRMCLGARVYHRSVFSDVCIYFKQVF